MNSSAQSDELLTLADVAVYLKLAEKTVHRMVQKGEIPCFKVASQWRFSKRMIDQWLHSKMHTPPRDEVSRLLETEPELVTLSRLTSPEMIIENLSPGTKENILQQLVQPLVAGGFLEQGSDFLNRLMERENMISTALGNGVAMPHIRNPQNNPGAVPCVVVGRCTEGVDFRSLDGSPTYLFFLVFSSNITVHLRIISRISRILLNTDLVPRLIGAETKEELYRLLTAEDQEVLQVEKSRKDS